MKKRLQTQAFSTFWTGPKSVQNQLTRVVGIILLNQSFPVNPLGPRIANGIFNLLELRGKLTQFRRVTPQLLPKLLQPHEN